MCYQPDCYRYVHHQSSLKTSSSHPLKFIPLEPSCDTYKYSFWPRTITDWNSLPPDYSTLDSTSKFKATISDYIFQCDVYPLRFIYLFIYFFFPILIFPSCGALVISEELANMSVRDVVRCYM